MSTFTPSGQKTPRAPSQASTMRPGEQLHRGQGCSAFQPTRDELDGQISEIKSKHLKDPQARLHALTHLRTQVLGFLTAKGKEKAGIDLQLEQQQQRMSRNSDEVISMLEAKEMKRQEMFDICGRRFNELGEAIDEAHEEILFGSTADHFSGL